MSTAFKYGVDQLTIAKTIAIASGKLKAVLSEEAIKKINASHKNVEAIVANSKTVYGVNTGFGILANTHISAEDTATLQHKILQSHSVGVGDPIPTEIAKIMLITKVQSLAQGYSGVQLSTLESASGSAAMWICSTVPDMRQENTGGRGRIEMMVSAPLGTLLTAMVTPFAADGSVNLDAARRLARHLVDTGSDGIVVAGTTGEGPTVTDREKLDLIEAVVAEVGGRATVIANTGSYDTHHSVELTTAALPLGVDGYLVVTPYYNKPPEEGIVAHFAAIADAADGRPLIAYNIPSRVVLNLEPRVLARLAEIPNVVGVKQAMPDLDQARAILDDGGLALYAGDDNLLLPFLRMGGTGGICVVSHLAGSRLRDMIDAAHDGRFDDAQAIDDGLVPLYRALTVTTNPIPVKAGLNMLGHDVGGLRLPMVEATVEQVGVVRTALETCGIPVPAPAA